MENTPLTQRVDHYVRRLEFFNEKLKVATPNEREGLTWVIQELSNALLAAIETELKTFEEAPCPLTHG